MAKRFDTNALVAEQFEYEAMERAAKRKNNLRAGEHAWRSKELPKRVKAATQYVRGETVTLDGGSKVTVVSHDSARGTLIVRDRGRTFSISPRAIIAG